MKVDIANLKLKNYLYENRTVISIQRVELQQLKRRKAMVGRTHFFLVHHMVIFLGKNRHSKNENKTKNSEVTFFFIK